MIGILNLPETVKELLISNKLSMSHARVLSKMEDEDRIRELAEKIVSENLSVRQIENISGGEEKKVKIVRTNTSGSEYQVIEEVLKDKFGTKVKLSSNKIEIHFTSKFDLNRILEIMKIEE